MELSLRRAKTSDVMSVFQWANDPLVRSYSFSSDPISLETHSKWFESKLGTDGCIYLILEVNGTAAGQIRYDVKDTSYTISFGIAKEFRGQGLGTIILKLGEEFLSEAISGSIELIGYVKKQNIASVVSFEKNGYTKTEAKAGEYADTFLFTKTVYGKHKNR